MQYMGMLSDYLCPYAIVFLSMLGNHSPANTKGLRTSERKSAGKQGLSRPQRQAEGPDYGIGVPISCQSRCQGFQPNIKLTGGIPMKTTNTTPITIANGITISNREFKRLSYDAYLRYIEMVTGKITGQTFAKAIKPYLANFGIPMTQQTMSLLSGYMVNYGTVNHEKALKIKGVAAFKSFTLTLYSEMMTKINDGKVSYKLPKAPAQTKTRKPTKDQQIAALKAEIAALKGEIEAK